MVFNLNYNQMFTMLADIPTDFSNVDYRDIGAQPMSYIPTFYDTPPMTDGWGNTFSNFKSTPVLYNLDGFISPYSSQNWGGTSNILKFVERDERLGNNIDKIDPNKIFSSEMNGLRALASDQQKIIKMVEKKLIESLADQRKTGLTESDIDALSALSTARSTIATITKEQSNIKKNITDIKLKQYQISDNKRNEQLSMNTGGNQQRTMSPRGASPTQLLDDLFKSTASANTGNVVGVDYNTPSINPTELIDSIVSSTSDHLRYESEEPTTYVVVDNDNGGRTSYATYTKDGRLLEDYPNPDEPIKEIDYDAGVAINTLDMRYPIKTE